MADSAIEWTQKTWNPTTGCDRCSPGCGMCYALPLAGRLQLMGQEKYANDGDPDTSGPGFAFTEHPDALLAPLAWKTPQRVFVNSMSDLFHPDATTEFIAQVFAVMALTARHTYQVLTKRPQRMADLLAERAPLAFGMIDEAITKILRDNPSIDGQRLDGTSFRRVQREAAMLRTQPCYREYPLRNVWLGTSIETDRYSFRADHLRRTPGAIRFISAEPLLGPLPSLDLRGIDWVIVGGESKQQKGTRPDPLPMHPAWVRDLRDRCTVTNGGRLAAAQQTADEVDRIVASQPPGWAHQRGPAFFFKQWGAWAPLDHEDGDARFGEFHGGTDFIESCMCSEGDGSLYLIGKHRAGRTIDGRTWDEYPEPAAC